MGNLVRVAEGGVPIEVSSGGDFRRKIKCGNTKYDIAMLRNATSMWCWVRSWCSGSTI